MTVMVKSPRNERRSRLGKKPMTVMVKPPREDGTRRPSEEFTTIER